MQKSHLMKLVTMVLVASFAFSVYAKIPAWTFSSPKPAQGLVGQNEQITVEYIVTNQSSKQKSLYLQQTPGLSALPCYLAKKGSTCILTLLVEGNHIPAQGLHTGPLLCEQGNPNQCYQPSKGNLLQIIKNKHPIKERYWSSVGVYINNVGNSLPVTYVSKDNAMSWVLSQVLPPNPQGSVSSDLRSISCGSDGHCAAVGHYDNGNGASSLSYVSSDFGNIWILSTVLPLSPQGSVFSQLYSISCDSSGHCAAVGFYSDGSNDYPLSYVSSDFGNHWTLSVTLPSLPQGAVSGGILSITCDSIGHCAAVGFYNDGSNEYPLSYVSSDFGNHWALSVTLPSLPQGGVSGNLLGMTCDSSGHCATVGFYNDGSNDYPLSHVSSDFGNHWTLSVTRPPLPGDALMAMPYALSSS